VCGFTPIPQRAWNGWGTRLDGALFTAAFGVKRADFEPQKMAFFGVYDYHLNNSYPSVCFLQSVD
jgi:hypothetical protein